MRLNAFFPTRDIGTDPAKICRLELQAAEALRYAHIEVPDHVFRCDRAGWMGADLQ